MPTAHWAPNTGHFGISTFCSLPPSGAEQWSGINIQTQKVELLGKRRNLGSEFKTWGGGRETPETTANHCAPLGSQGNAGVGCIVCWMGEQEKAQSPPLGCPAPRERPLGP